MSGKLHAYWWALPLSSGIFFLLAFYPFDWWPFAFIALVPLYYFAAVERSGRRVFWGGFITAACFSFSLSYFTVIGFHWLPQAYLFADLVRLSVVPIVLCSGGMIGAFIWAYSRLRGESVFLNALLAAAFYVIPELLLRAVFGGYYLGTLAYAATSVPALMSFAALGGTPLVSFVIAWLSGILVEALLWWRSRPRAVAGAAGLSLLMFVAAFLPNWLFLHVPAAPVRTLSVALIQDGDRTKASFGSDQNGTFSFPQLGTQLDNAAQGKPDLVIYPFSPVEGTLYRGAKTIFDKNILVASETEFAAWEARQLPASTTLLTWNNVYVQTRFMNEYEFWQDGKVVSEYQKRELFPFMDYTPQWAQRIGFFTTPFDSAAGIPDNHAEFAGVPIGGLLCSELDQPDLARGEAFFAPLIIAVGSEAMFDSPVASEYSLKAAQFRAAENNVPVIRGNLLGPSGIAARDGSLIAALPAGRGGILRASLILTAPRPTLYSRLGDAPLFVLLCGILASALWPKRLRSRVQN